MDVKAHRSRSGRRCQHQLDRLLHLQLDGPLVHHLLQQDHLLLQLLVEQHVQQQRDAPLDRQQQDVQRDQQQLGRHVHHPQHLDHRLLHLEKRASRVRTEVVVNLGTPGQTRAQQPSLDSSTSFPTSRCFYSAYVHLFHLKNLFFRVTNRALRGKPRQRAKTKMKTNGIKAKAAILSTRV